MSDRWQFWIDVGGTFTDCLARRPDGSLARYKLLSSGVTKGVVGPGSTSATIVDAVRGHDPVGYWHNATIDLLDDLGNVVASSWVAHFDLKARSLRLHTPFSVTPQAGQTYELKTSDEAPIVAIRWLLGLAAGQPLPPISLRLGTTRGTNALLTRSGARTAFITTRGFADILRIGYQNRPRLFDLNIVKPAPLFESVCEIDERVDADGRVLQPPEPEAIRQQLLALKQTGVESLAICLLNAYEFAEHERLVERLAREVGFDEISVSSRIAPLIKLVSRGDTTVVDAYLNPVLRHYVASLRQKLHNDSDFRLLTSAGGLVTAENFVGKDSILSGPAGGVVGFAAVAEAAGFTRAIGFDMGGTSTDVARYDGRFEREYETEKAGVRIVAPMMAIETVAAGGGSICWFDGVKLCVGPASCGASPGPACYGAGGPLAITDVNLALGKILPEHFPFRLDRAAVDDRLQKIGREIQQATGQTLSPLELASGFVRVANARMAQAIRSVSIAKGCDVRDYVLVAFGGAAGQHACAIARELGITQILNHPDAGILSAYGIGMANVERHQVEGLYRLLDEHTYAALPAIFTQLAERTTSDVLAEGVAASAIEIELALDLRYRGLDAFLTITQPADGDWAAAYAREHGKLYGYTHDDKPLEIVAARVTAVGRGGDRPPAAERVSPSKTPMPTTTTMAHFDNITCATNVYVRDSLRPGDFLTGPAIVVERIATTVIDPRWSAEVLSDGQMLITWAGEGSVERNVGGDAQAVSTDAADPILLEVFNNHFAAIASQMGITLRNTASSVNVKERLDFSCAVFTPRGELVVNAPHIPVHLGAMGLTVRSILADNPNMQPGDVFVTNDPYRGGSHLPDLTVVTPVFAQGQGANAPRSPELLFFTASRAHHAEIGGIRAGSMPPFSKNLAEEGVLIRNFKLVDAGRSCMSNFRELLTTARYPTRNIADNLADVSAQIAANQQGARDLLTLVERYTQPIVAAYMRHIQAAAELKTRRALAKLADGRREFVDHLDDGSPICVAITIHDDQATIDFTGTGPVLAGNLNANRAIVTAAVMYVLRCLIDEDIPLNEGVLAPVEIILPECLLNPPAQERAEDCAAIVGGNVETSQRIVDVLLGAFGLAAASQGTMNNLLFGDASFGYYETIGGGAGATSTAAGADAVHTHMTNTRLTDPEVLERRYGVRVREFAIRRGSGGAGKHCGGDGILRRIEFLQPLDVSIVSQRRGPYAPYGLDGGAAGELGENTLEHANGTCEKLAGQAQFTAQPGDALTIATPGGGAWGE